MANGDSLPAWLEVVAYFGQAPSKWVEVDRSYDSSSVVSAFEVFNGIGTAFAFLRIVNILGQTILEKSLRNQEKESEDRESKISNDSKQPRSFLRNKLCHGFQFLHGWNETILGILCEDVPQLFLLLAFSVSCKANWQKMVRDFI